MSMAVWQQRMGRRRMRRGIGELPQQQKSGLVWRWTIDVVDDEDVARTLRRD